VNQKTYNYSRQIKENYDEHREGSTTVHVCVYIYIYGVNRESKGQGKIGRRGGDERVGKNRIK